MKIVVIVAVLLLGGAMVARIVEQQENGVLFRFSRVIGERPPGFRLIIPFADVRRRVSLWIVTMTIQSQGISPATTSSSTSPPSPTSKSSTR